MCGQNGTEVWPRPQVTLSGSVLVHSGRKPSLFWVSGRVLLVSASLDGSGHQVPGSHNGLPAPPEPRSDSAGGAKQRFHLEAAFSWTLPGLAAPRPAANANVMSEGQNSPR